MEYEWKTIRSKIQKSGILTEVKVIPQLHDNHTGLSELACYMIWLSEYKNYIFKGNSLKEYVQEVIQQLQNDDENPDYFFENNQLTVIHEYIESPKQYINLLALYKFFDYNLEATSYFCYYLETIGIGFIHEINDMFPFESFCEMEMSEENSILNDYFSDNFPQIAKIKFEKYLDGTAFATGWDFVCTKKPKNLSLPQKDLIKRWEKLFKKFHLSDYIINPNTFVEDCLIPTAYLRVGIGNEPNFYQHSYNYDVSDFVIESIITLNTDNLPEKEIDSINYEGLSFRCILDKKSQEKMKQSIFEFNNLYNELCNLTV